MYTSHGHHIPGTDFDNIPPLATMCGGVPFCRECHKEAFQSLHLRVTQPCVLKDEVDHRQPNFD